MKFTRRQFLASGVALPVAAAIPVGLVPAEKAIASVPAVKTITKSWFVGLANVAQDLTNDEVWLEAVGPVGASWANPFTSMNQLIDKMKAGDTVYVRDTRIDDGDLDLLPTARHLHFEGCEFESSEAVDKAREKVKVTPAQLLHLKNVG